MKDESKLDTILKCILWWIFVALWFWLIKRLSGSGRRRRRAQVSRDASPWHNWTQEELETRKIFINDALITKEVSSISGDGLITYSIQKVHSKRDVRKQSYSTQLSKEDERVDQGILDSNQEKLSEQETEQEKGGILKRSISLLSLVLEQLTNSDKKENICSICLGEYEVGQEVSWSPNPKCRHSFHTNCISQWLIKRDECPCCRCNYLIKDDENLTVSSNLENDSEEASNILDNTTPTDIVITPDDRSICSEYSDVELGLNIDVIH